MATIQLSDIIDVTVFEDLQSENDPKLTALYQSGVIASGEMFDALASAAGRSAELPFWRDLDHTSEPNYSSDQATSATPDKVQQDEMKTRKVHVNNGWSAMDLAVELQTGTNAMQHIRDRTAAYWTYYWQDRLVACALGILNANVNGNFATQSPGTAGDMVIDVAIEDGNNAAAANLFSRSAFVNAVFTMGDRGEDIRAICVHSVVMKKMVDQDDIAYILDSAGTTRIPTYMGRTVIVDDSCPTVAGTTSGFKYVSILFGRAMFAYGEGSPNVPVEVWRDPQTGHGGGEEQLWLRKTWLLHPFGHTNNNAVATGNSGNQTLADLRNQSNWTRVLARKNVPMAFLVTNG